ncbi:MAG: hypothetical protein PHU23_04960 [Dehalococcoidales bacterium]|nr:hypothetical protein [Dehalococcoidales bacterium]
MVKCVVCDKPFEPAVDGQSTCSTLCHNELVRYYTWRFGEFKKIVRISTGEAFKVPMKDIIEKGICEQDLDKYPRWED